MYKLINKYLLVISASSFLKASPFEEDRLGGGLSEIASSSSSGPKYSTKNTLTIGENYHQKKRLNLLQQTLH